MVFLTTRIEPYFMRLGLLALVVLMILTAAPATRAAPAARGVADSPALQALVAQAQANGAVRVIVHLNAPFSPENERDVLEAARSKRPLPDAARAQREGIQQAQDALLQRLAGRKVDGVKRFDIIPLLALEVDAPTLAALAADPDVASIREDGVRSPDNLGSSVRLIGGSPLGTFGTGDYSGAGQTIAIIDTGVMKTHQFLSDANGKTRVVSEACYSTRDLSKVITPLCLNSTTTESTAAGSGVNCPMTIDDCDHGTHVAGIAAGRSFPGQQDGSFNGVAKDATIIAIQAASEYHSTQICDPDDNLVSECAKFVDSDVIKGLTRIAQIAPYYRIAAVNMSLGGGAFSTDAMCQSADPGYKPIIDTLTTYGIAVIATAGNDGYTDRIGQLPACISSAIAVGSTDLPNGNVPEKVSGDSNMSSAVDLLAPGRSGTNDGGILSSVPDMTGSATAFAKKGGTSMAAPHVAGAWAVLRGKLLPTPTVPQGVKDILSLLQRTGQPITDTRPGGTQTKPRIRLGAAVDSVGTTCQDPFDRWSADPYTDPSFDDNDSELAADPITVDGADGNWHIQYFCSTVDEDWVTFNVVTDGTKTYQVKALSLSPNNDPLMEVYAANSAGNKQPTLVQTSDDSDDGGYGTKVIFTPSSGDTFYVRVRPAASGVGGSTAFAYSLTVRTLGNLNTDADDDTAAKALPFTINTTVSRGLGSADQDWVKFEVTKPNTKLRIETLNLGVGQDFQQEGSVWVGTDTQLSLLKDPNAAPLAESYDIQIRPGEEYVPRSLLDYTFSSPGTYYLKVFPAPTTGGVGQTYDLRITRLDQPAASVTAFQSTAAISGIVKPTKACPEDTAETTGDGNNSAQAADLITSATTPVQYFCSTKDEDWFKFNVSLNVTYQLRTHIVSANNDPFLEVYSDAGQTLVASNDDSDDDGTPSSGGYRAGVSFTAASSGTYYARFRPSPTASGVGGDASFSYLAQLINKSSLLCGFNEPDNNAATGQAKDFVVGTIESRALCGDNDQDWVRIKVTKPNTTLRIETLNLGTARDANGIWQGADTKLELYGSLSAPKLADNDNVSSATGARRSAIEYTFATPGAYFVKVLPSTNLSGPGQTYDLRITRVDKVLAFSPQAPTQ
jgi:hypothetical protein